MRAALLDWNHSSTYVSGVLDWAARDTVGGAQAISPVMVGWVWDLVVAVSRARKHW
jgi:hypothetical protein